MAPGPLRSTLPDPSIDRRSDEYKQSDVGKALFLTLKKALEQGMIGDDKDFSEKVCVKWKDTDRLSVRPRIVSGRVGEEERLFSGEKNSNKSISNLMEALATRPERWTCSILNEPCV